MGVGQTPGTLGTSQLGQSQGCGTNGHLEAQQVRTLEACASIPRWTVVIALGGLATLGTRRFLSADSWARRYMSGTPEIKRAGGLAWGLPALGKLLQARRDLNLPTSG